MASYPEANDMQKRMLAVSQKVASAGKTVTGTSRKLAEARTCLFRAQCNCAYWHGIFGGIYLPHLREAVYSNLIKADKLADSLLEKGRGYLNVVCRDFDNDGHDEVSISDSVKSVCISPGLGGSIKTLEDRKSDTNFLATFARHQEAYHSRLSRAGAKRSSGVSSIHDAMPAKEKGLAKLLFYDRHRRYAFIDRWFEKKPTAKSLHEAVPAAIDFSNEPYDFALNTTSRTVDVMMRGEASSGRGVIVLTKVIRNERNTRELTANYEIALSDRSRQSGCLGIELNLSFLARDDKRVRYSGKFKRSGSFTMGTRGETEPSESFSVLDNLRGKKVTLRTSQPAVFIWYPVQTVSQSESGFERIYQCSCINAVFPLKLHEAQPHALSLTLSIEDI